MKILQKKNIVHQLVKSMAAYHSFTNSTGDVKKCAHREKNKTVNRYMYK